jgi:spoIIIJ-associated protein
MNTPRRPVFNRPPNKERFQKNLPAVEPRLDRERVIAELNTFLALATREMGLAVTFEISNPPSTEAGREEGDVLVTFGGDDQEMLLENDAELLLSLEHIAHRWLRLDPRLHDRVRFDCGEYRATRLADLKLSARVGAQRARDTSEPFRFNPMSPRERRIVHLELSGAPGVRTESEGSGDRRQLVVYPIHFKK